MTFGSKLKGLMNKQGVNNNQLSKRSHLGSSTITYLIHNKRHPKPSTLKKLSKGLDVPYATLTKIAGIAPVIPNNAIMPKGYVKVPIVGSIPCGDPNTAIQETNHYKLVPSFEPHVGYMFLRADGQSMEPAIKNKALVKIHLQHTIENKEIAAVSVNGADATLKQVVKDNNDKIVMFHPLNPNFSDIFPTADNHCRIIGKAVAVENPL